MSSRIRGRRYRNIDPDERYGFTSSGESTGPSDIESEPAIIAVGPVILDGVSHDAAAVTMDGTTVTVEPGDLILSSETVFLEPRTVTGPSQTEG